MRFTTRIFFFVMLMLNGGSDAFAATCNSDSALTGVVKNYGVDASNRFTQIDLIASDGSTVSQLINKVYPLDTDSGKAIDKIVMLSYISGEKLTIWCDGNNQFSSVKFEN